MKDITFEMLEGLRGRGNKHPLIDIVQEFIWWTKTKGGCWWWIKGEVKKCIKRKVIYYRGSITKLKKEEFAIIEIPFTEYPTTKSKTKLKKYPVKDYANFKELLVEEWLKFINQDEGIKRGILERLINTTM